MLPRPQFRNEILSALPPAAIEAIRPYLRVTKLDVGQVLFDVGQRVEAVYFIESGLVSLVIPFEDGREIENTSRGRDGGIGYVEACGSQEMVSRAVVQIGGRALCLEAAQYRAVFDSCPAMREQIYRRTEFLIAEARHKSACRAVHPAPGRLAATLLEVFHHTGERRLRLTQEFLAGMIGVGRTTVNQSATRLQELKLIRYRRGGIVLEDVDALERHTCECYGVVRGLRERLLSGELAAA